MLLVGSAGLEVRLQRQGGLVVVGEADAASFHAGLDGEGVPGGHDVFSFGAVWILLPDT